MQMTRSLHCAVSAARTFFSRQVFSSAKRAGWRKKWLVFPFLVLLFQCSTYFNTFYNAESAFNEGYTIHERAMRNFPDSIVTEPPADARAKYDRAIEKAAKVLEVFPKDKKWHDDAVYLLGKAYFYEKETSKAVRRFRELQQQYPQSPFVPESYLYLAKTYITDDNLIKAEETLKFALDRYPFLDKDQKISLLLVEIEIRREGKSQAIGRLERVRSSMRSPQQQTDLLLRIVELQMGLGQFDKAAALLKKAPRTKKDPLQEYRIDRDLVACYEALGSQENALKLLAGMRSNRQYLTYYKEILYDEGCILERQGKIDEAIDIFKEIVGTGATDSVAAKLDTTRIAGKAWFELGQLYQKKKGNFKQAQKYYKFVTERQLQDTPATPTATLRLAAMKQLQELRSGLSALRDSAAKRQASLYKIGELFYYELEEPDSAYRSFFSLAKDSAADTPFAPKALCAAAGIARKDLKDTARSDSVYALLLARFPGTDYACTAQREMRAAVVAKTRKQQAEEAFRDAEKAYLAGSDPKGAVQAYFNVFKKYPDCEVAPRSLFAAAWIADNDLEKKKTAKALYEKICERYPHSVYCSSEAQPRIKVVLDTLEALRRENKTPDQAALPEKNAADAKPGVLPSPPAQPGPPPAAAASKTDSLVHPAAPAAPHPADAAATPAPVGNAPPEEKKSGSKPDSVRAVVPSAQAAPSNAAAPASPQASIPQGRPAEPVGRTPPAIK